MERRVDSVNRPWWYNVIYDLGRVGKNILEAGYGATSVAYYRYFDYGNIEGIEEAKEGRDSDAEELGEAAVDLGADAIATAIPFVPAGVTKAARKIAKAARKSPPSRAKHVENQKAGADKLKWKCCQDHHVATNKHQTEWTPKLNALFQNVGMDLNDWANACMVCDIGDGKKHRGPHVGNDNEYHKMVYAALSAVNTATAGQDQESRQAGLRAALVAICIQLNRKGKLRDMVTQ